jgi:foldase protein PrsA
MTTLRRAGSLTALAGLLGACLAAGAPAEPVALVNGKPIDQAALYQYMLMRTGYRSLYSLIGSEIVRQEAEKRGITVTEQEIDTEIARKRETFDRTAIQTGVTFDRLLASRGQTMVMYRQSERTLLLLKKMVQPQVKVADQDVSERYQRNQDQFRLKEAMRVSYIRFDDAKTATQVRQDIVKGSIKFDEAARKYSTDPFTKDQGGKLEDWLSRGRTPFLQAAFELLQNGDLTDIIPWPGMGLYLIRRDEYVRDYQLDFDVVKNDLRNILTDDMTRNLVAAKERELMKAAKIDIKVQWPEGSIIPPEPEEGATEEPTPAPGNP